MEFNPFPDLLNTEFTIIETGLVYGGEHLGSSLCRAFCDFILFELNMPFYYVII